MPLFIAEFRGEDGATFKAVGNSEEGELKPHLTYRLYGQWQEKEKCHPDMGGIALQVHGGGNMTNQFVRYRNIRVKKLN